jgi:hypothetical protein
VWKLGELFPCAKHRRSSCRAWTCMGSRDNVSPTSTPTQSLFITIGSLASD